MFAQAWVTVSVLAGVLVLCVAIALGPVVLFLLLRVWARRAGRVAVWSLEELDTPQIAFLAGGPLRVGDVVLARMLHDGLLEPVGDTSVTGTGKHGRGELERAALRLLDNTPSVSLGTFRDRLGRSSTVGNIGTVLVGWGLLVPPRRARRISIPLRLPAVLLGIMATLPWFLVTVMVLGEHPFRTLLILVGGMCAGGLLRGVCLEGAAKLDIRRTRAGRRLLRQARRGTPVPGPVWHEFALHGPEADHRQNLDWQSAVAMVTAAPLPTETETDEPHAHNTTHEWSNNPRGRVALRDWQTHGAAGTPSNGRD